MEEKKTEFCDVCDYPIENPSHPEYVCMCKGDSRIKERRADRFNKGKVRFDLVPKYPLKQIAKVMTKGAEKYAPYNWMKGMPWSECEASLRRHLEAYADNEDFDYDQKCEGCKSGNCTKHSGLYHLAHVAVNAMFLIQYYRSHPEFDDRPKGYLKKPKIALDIDEVVCGWLQGYKAKTGKETIASYWDNSYGMGADLEMLSKDKEFWLNLPCIRKPDFIPHAYVSSRGIPVEWTKEWIEKVGLPTRPVYHVNWGASKVAVLKNMGAEYFIDDRFENFVEVQNAGICAFLMDAEHNQHYDVGYKRIKELKLKEIVRY